MDYLFSARGRLNRARFWLAALIYMAWYAALALVMVLLWQVIPGEIGENGTFNVSGAKALPYIALALGTLIATIWSGICVAIKRYHDRDKSGWWVLIQLIPFVGSIWYFIEAGCLRGTAGPNQYGPDPLGDAAYSAGVNVGTARA